VLLEAQNRVLILAVQNVLVANARIKAAPSLHQPPRYVQRNKSGKNLKMSNITSTRCVTGYRFAILNEIFKSDSIVLGRGWLDVEKNIWQIGL
jgi:hypothetical protein